MVKMFLLSTLNTLTFFIFRINFQFFSMAALCNNVFGLFPFFAEPLISIHCTILVKLCLNMKGGCSSFCIKWTYIFIPIFIFIFVFQCCHFNETFHLMQVIPAIVLLLKTNFEIYPSFEFECRLGNVSYFNKHYFRHF